MRVIIIGGGPAGMMAAISVKENNKNAEVIILEKMNSCGRKLLITGKGRCNITSSLENMQDFINNTPGNGKFLYSAFQNYTNKDIVNMLEQLGVKTKVERGNRIFPLSDSSKDVLNAFLKKLNNCNVTIKNNVNVKEILTDGEKVVGVKVFTDEQEKVIDCEKVILATGGKSYPGTGSTRRWI